jgi:unsaturated rhamnogalacturonyl hydrolase
MIFEEYIKEYAKKFDRLERNMWNYEDGCVLVGLLALYAATGDKFYFDIVRRYADRYILPDGTIRLYTGCEYNLDYILSGRIFFTLFAYTHEERFRLAADTLMAQLENQPRTSTGSFWHKGIYPNQVWLDGLYMALPFYTEYENTFGSGKKYQDILLQFQNARAYLYDDTKKLYYHAWEETKTVFWADKTTGRSPNFWTRAAGWYLMALADVYELVPDSQAEIKASLSVLWKEAVDGILIYQDRATGLFFQLTALPEQPGNYLETSGSLMIAYSLLKGLFLGIFTDKQYYSAALQIMLGVESRQFSFVSSKLSLGGICKGAGLGPAGNFRRNGSVEYYLSEEVVCDEQKGVGICMLAYAQWLKMKKTGHEHIFDYPLVEIFSRGYDPVIPPGNPAYTGKRCL